MQGQLSYSNCSAYCGAPALFVAGCSCYAHWQILRRRNGTSKNLKLMTRELSHLLPTALSSVHMPKTAFVVCSPASAICFHWFQQ